MHTPGTWRRLKLASEIRLGHGLPRLPQAELVRLLGLLAAIRDGRGTEVLQNEPEQERVGQREATTVADLASACIALAKRVDVRPFL